MSAIWEGYRLRPRTLSGATVLQIVSDPRDASQGRFAFETASALVQAGARAIVAGEGRGLTERLRAAGAEWLDFPVSTVNPLKMRRSVRLLEQTVAMERVDIVHALGVGPAWAARIAASRMPMWIVTSLPDNPARRTPALHVFDAALARGDRVIAASEFAARPWIERHRIAAERVVIVPHRIETAVFAPWAVTPERVAAIRQAWNTRRSDRIVLAPAPLSPANGQALLIEAARSLFNGGLRNTVFILAGDPRHNPSFAGKLTQRIQALGLKAFVRIVPLPPDLPAALAAAHCVVAPALQPPATTRIIAQAQSLGRPVVVADVGALSEAVLTPPRMPEELRTGWLVKPDDIASLGHALHCALGLDPMEYQAIGARARQFAEFAFAPDRVAAAIRAVYTSVLSRDG